MGLRDNIVSKAKEIAENRREIKRDAAERRIQEEDAGWAYHLSVEIVNHHIAKKIEALRFYASDRAGNRVYTIEQAHIPLKRAMLASNASGEVVAQLNCGFARNGAFVAVKVGGKTIGTLWRRIIKREGRWSQGLYFEPLGLTLSREGLFNDHSYVIRDNQGNEIAAIFFNGKYAGKGTCRINYNSQRDDLIALVMLAAVDVIEAHETERTIKAAERARRRNGGGGG